MSKENKSLVHRYYEQAIGDLSQIDQIVADDFVDHHFPPNLPQGPDGVRQFFSQVLAGIFGDMRIEHEDMIAEDDKVVCRFALHATHQGEFAGVAATGKAIRCPAISIFRIADGKLAEAWEIADIAGLMGQIQSD